ncbi:hypothetical protein FPV67DRAFT_1488140 [Lyophyllum atratum]|nr:hypothetical protein FPV67DRAFT_1488140 [Lyophyllum atratum]
MPSSAAVLPVILLLHAFATHAAPLVDVSPDPSHLSPRDGACHILGFPFDNPCVTLQLLRNHNSGCRPDEHSEFLFFDRLLGSCCDSDDGIGRSLLGSNLNFFNKRNPKEQGDFKTLRGNFERKRHNRDEALGESDGRRKHGADRAAGHYQKLINTSPTRRTIDRELLGRGRYLERRASQGRHKKEGYSRLRGKSRRSHNNDDPGRG